jgi:hypothetical protein
MRCAAITRAGERGASLMLLTVVTAGLTLHRPLKPASNAGVREAKRGEPLNYLRLSVSSEQ